MIRLYTPEQFDLINIDDHTGRGLVNWFAAIRAQNILEKFLIDHPELKEAFENLERPKPHPIPNPGPLPL